MSLIKKQFNFKPELLIRAIILCWFITKIICYKLWLSDRLFPLVPVHDIFTGIPNGIHLFLLIASLGAMIALFVFPQKNG